MFDFLRGPAPEYGVSNAAAQQERFLSHEQKQLAELVKVVDAMCKVYVAEHAKEIESRDPDERWFKTDQPIIDRAKRLELERQIKVAEMELKELKRKVG